MGSSELSHRMTKEDQIPFSQPLPLVSLNHVSIVCKSVTASTKFYENVLGFQQVRRPSSFDFEGAWLFNYGVGIHLLQCRSSDDLPNKTKIDPRDNHIAFQCPDVILVENKLQQMEIKYEKFVVEDEGLYIVQLFFHDPDGYMLEICNCENVPVIPVSSSVRSTSMQFASAQSKPKMEAEGSCSEIALVPMNVPAPQVDIIHLRKEIEATARAQTGCPSDANDDNRPYFLDIMDFYL